MYCYWSAFFSSYISLQIPNVKLYLLMEFVYWSSLLVLLPEDCDLPKPFFGSWNSFLNRLHLFAAGKCIAYSRGKRLLKKLYSGN